MSKKILHIITGLEQGGAEKILLDICSNKSQDNLVVSLTGKGYYFHKFISRNIKTYFLGISLSNPLTILNISKLIFIYIKYQPKVIQTWLYHSDLIGSLLSLFLPYHSLIWTVVHSDISFKSNKFNTYIIVRILSILSHFLPRSIIYNAHSSRQAHESIGYCKRKGVVIHTGIDVSVFKPIPEVRQKRYDFYNLDSQTLIIGSIARFHPIKNQELLLKSISIAIKQIQRPIHLIMAGEKIDYNNKEITRILKTNNIGNFVTLLGPRDNISEIMNCLDFLVLSSNSEACPNVILEASFCGIPSISTDVGDAKYMIGSYGYIVESNNSMQMAKAIIEISKLKEQQYKILSLGTMRRSLNEFSINRMLDSYSKVHDRYI
tara:strand:- start:1148 stop:2275 length:1128 start_codon:yes stop_codon:yes gene_type:complete